MKCRPHCGACCISPSIEEAYHGMPQGKKAGEACVHLDPQSFACRIWGSEYYPETCKRFMPLEEHCGQNRDEAIRLLDYWEQATQP